MFVRKNKNNFIKVGTSNQNEREIWLENTLKTIPKGNRILDAGAGELQYKKFCEHLEYVSQDFAQYDGEGDKTGLQTNTWDNSNLDIVSDITSIPVENKSFDAIMCIEVFEHLPNPALAIQEFSRILKPKGILIVTAPFCSLTHFAPYHFSTGFNTYFYNHHLLENGFAIDEITSNGNFFEYLAQEVRRLPSIAKKYSKYSLKNKDMKRVMKILPVLQDLSEKDTTSDELLCFGYHVKAHKKP